MPESAYLTAAYLHAPSPLQPEALEAVEEMLREMLRDTALAARVHRPDVPLLPRTYLEPVSDPGIHVRPLPRLATIAGVAIATDAGTRSGKTRQGCDLFFGPVLGSDIALSVRGACRRNRGSRMWVTMGQDP